MKVIPVKAAILVHSFQRPSSALHYVEMSFNLIGFIRYRDKFRKITNEANNQTNKYINHQNYEQNKQTKPGELLPVNYQTRIRVEITSASLRLSVGLLLSLLKLSNLKTDGRDRDGKDSEKSKGKA